MQYKFKVTKNKKDEYANKLTTSVLITLKSIVHISSNMIIFKPPKYSCFGICNVDDAKVKDKSALDQS